MKTFKITLLAILIFCVAHSFGYSVASVYTDGSWASLDGRTYTVGSDWNTSLNPNYASTHTGWLNTTRLGAGTEIGGSGCAAPGSRGTLPSGYTSLPQPYTVWATDTAYQGQFTYYRKLFYLPTACIIDSVNCFANVDDTLWLYVNGTYCGMIADNHLATLQTMTVATSLMHTGANLIAMKCQDKIGGGVGCAAVGLVIGVDYTAPVTTNLIAGMCSGSSDSCEVAVIGGGLLIDANNTNDGNITNTIKFGACGSGEAIGSTRTNLANQYGLDFYTDSIDRMVIANGGSVGIGTTAPEATASLNIIRPGSGSAVNNISYGLDVTVSELVTSFGESAGVRGIAQGSSTASNTINYGGLFEGANAATDNIGVEGVGNLGASSFGGDFVAVSGSTANYGIYASFITSNTPGPTNCAGYFSGACYSSGNLNPSDENLKTGIQAVDNQLPLLRKLQINTYTFKTDNYKSMNLPQGQQIGLLAQNLKSVYPNLVQQMINPACERTKEPATTFMAVNYTGLVPVLIKAVQELDGQITALQTQNQNLQNQISDLCSGGCAGFTGTATPAQNGNQLFQNVPNPYNQQTTISVAINTGTTAYINVNSLDGKLVKHLEITSKGRSSVSVNANELGSGTYVYSLYVDGNIVDSKLMIITSAE